MGGDWSGQNAAHFCACLFFFSSFSNKKCPTLLKRVSDFRVSSGFLQIKVPGCELLHGSEQGEKMTGSKPTLGNFPQRKVDTTP